MEVTNAPAYYKTATIMAVKGFIVQPHCSGPACQPNRYHGLIVTPTSLLEPEQVYKILKSH
jgi:hypothetical protein